MTDEGVTLEELPKRKVVFLSCKGSWRQLPDMLTRLSEYLASKGIETMGPPSGFYYNTLKESPADELDWEVCYPVEPNTTTFSGGDAKSGVRTIPSTRVAVIIHKGPYRKASISYEVIRAWLGNRGLRVCGPSEKVYLTGVTCKDEEQRIAIRLPVCPA